MPVRISTDGRTLTARLSGEIDHHSAAELRQEIDRAVERTWPEYLVLDFNGVTFMDSSGIGLVMGRLRLMKELSGEIMIANASKQIKKVMKFAGLEKLLAARTPEEMEV
jgi:stage II sporulation protein AA (anti-sigma F factor antagonist)